jgi:dTDP-glucose pyrophosphorylase/CBS domain-containing protein
MTVEELLSFLVEFDNTVQDVLRRIDRNRQGIALVVDSNRKLIDTLTDGDLRRAILAKIDLGASVAELLAKKKRNGFPLTAPTGTSAAELLGLMNGKGLRHIPLLDGGGRVVDIALLTELAKEQELNLRGVVMAGGLGTRLRPLTEDLPKPMLPIGGRPILEHIVEQFRASGIRRVSFTTHYKGEVIQDYFGDGSRFGISVGYTQEDQPLGTAGALRLLKDFDEPILVINGDILSRIDFNAFFDFHKEHNAQMTVAVRLHEVVVPYGLVETDGVAVTGLTEKPVIRHLVNAGIYLLNPEVRQYIPADRRFDMTDLIGRLLEEKRKVICFPVHESWIDVGCIEDYERAELAVSAELMKP